MVVYVCNHSVGAEAEGWQVWAMGRGDWGARDVVQCEGLGSIPSAIKQKIPTKQ